MKQPTSCSPAEETATERPGSQSDGPPTIDPAELMRLYVEKQHHRLTETLIDLLRHYQEIQYTQFASEGQARVDAFAESLLYLLTKPDFEIPNELAPVFVAWNHVIANLVAMSRFKNTDHQLGMLAEQPRNYVKVLALYSIRNSVQIDVDTLFSASVPLASTWYQTYLLCSAGWTTPLTWENARRHCTNMDPRLVLTRRTLVPPMYFQCTNIVPEEDKYIKAHLNRCVRTEVERIPVENNPVRNRIAVLTAKWFPTSAVYRSSFPYIRRLADGYQLTLVHLGKQREDLDTSLFSDVRHVVVDEDEVKLDDVLRNDFQVAYYPDVGMNAESIWLANMRLAPIQAMGYGHPVSTFGSEIDYFLGGAEAEIAEKAQENYSERLVLLPGIGAHPVYPHYQPKFPPRAEETIRINCSWGSSKLNYPMLMNLKTIREKANRPVKFRFYSGWALGRYNSVIPHLQDMGATLGKDAVVVSNRAYHAYMEHSEEGDFSLDSYPFGGYNSVMDSLYLAKPIVTFEGSRFYNRAASALLRRVGLAELIATSDQEYVDKALRLINDDDYRRRLTRLLRETDLRARLFDTQEPKYFKQAIDYLIQNHETLKRDRSREPVFIR